MADKNEVEKFLNELKEKIRVFDIVFRPRDKQLEGLIEIGIMPDQRKELILNLKTENYCSGPNEDTFDPSKPNYYVFGIPMAHYEIYIKLSIGLPKKSVDCMSFHISDRKMKFPLKETNDEK